jgi:hypothetical protein
MREKIIPFLDERAVYISNHARIRMFERNISTSDIFLVLRNGDIIEEYNDDDPCPSVLILGFIHKTPVHCVTAVCADHLRIVTVYIPDNHQWIDYRTRKVMR